MTLRLNKIEDKVKTYLRQKLLPRSEIHVCVCFSGGIDSTVLLWMMHRLRDELGIGLSACHFNHMLRGAEADGDEQFCVQICKQLNIPLYCGRADVANFHMENKISVEEAAREMRYAWFCETAHAHGIDLMATAHHQDDQAETVLFRVIRGTTVSGLAGIPPKRDIFVRPLLCLTKEEICFYANELSLNYRTDLTNFSEQYTRNYIRQTVFPVLKSINPSVSDALVRLSKYAVEDDCLISSLLPQYEDVQNVQGLPQGLLRRIVARNYSVFSGNTLCYQHVDEICNAACLGLDKRIGLPDGDIAVVSGGYLFFEKESSDTVYEIENGVLEEGITYACNKKIRIIFCKNQPHEISRLMENSSCEKEIVYNLSTEILLSFDKIYGMIRYRARQHGDRLRIHGINRSVKKLFSEQNIPIHLRQMIPVFWDDVGLLCIPHVAVSDRVYCDAEHATHYMRVDLIDERSRKVVKSL